MKLLQNIYAVLSTVLVALVLLALLIAASLSKDQRKQLLERLLRVQL